jgi:hypothetical protein
MDRRRVARELDALTNSAGSVVVGVLAEVAMLPVDAQNPVLVAQALASARVVADPESAAFAPAAFARMMARLDQLREGVDDDD